MNIPDYWGPEMSLYQEFQKHPDWTYDKIGMRFVRNEQTWFCIEVIFDLERMHGFSTVEEVMEYIYRIRGDYDIPIDQDSLYYDY